jgi:hypothetical protein
MKEPFPGANALLAELDAYRSYCSRWIRAHGADGGTGRLSAYFIERLSTPNDHEDYGLACFALAGLLTAIQDVCLDGADDVRRPDPSENEENEV